MWSEFGLFAPWCLGPEVSLRPEVRRKILPVG
jgi:hypothetical protein